MAGLMTLTLPDRTRNTERRLHAVPARTRFFAVFAGERWIVVDELQPELENFGPFASVAEAYGEIESPYADNDLPLYHPSAAEHARMQRAKYLRLIAGLAVS
jgi:hypothetical protein